ncbi:MAG: LysR family transcriptional regulator [Sedimenticola sp.]
MPFKGLQYFEVVARHGSFKLAAEESHVTPPAISQQIKILEDYFGFELFRRSPQKVHLSEQGAVLLRGVQSSFDLLNHTIDQLVDSNRHIRVRTTSSFYSMWLLPIVVEYENTYLNADVRVSAGIENHTFTSNHDIEIIYSPVPFDNVDGSLFMIPERLIPVCSPAYRQLKEPSLHSLGQHRLILNSPEGYDWHKWAEAQELCPDTIQHLTNHGIKMISDASAIEAAMSGMGIGLANISYVRSHIESGRLVQACEAPVFELGYHYGKKISHNNTTELNRFSEFLASKACA